MSWDIVPFKTLKNDLPKTEGMECGVICKFPSMQLFVGQSNSGKSTLLCNMCVNPKLMGEFFDKIYLISPTAKIDDLVEHLELDPDNTWDDLPKAAIDLETLLDNQAFDIEEEGIDAVAKDRKTLVICDDCVGNKQFMKSDVLTKLAIHGRHNLVSSIICTQSYTKVPRAIRIQAQGLALFPSNQNEVKLINEDYCPSGCSHKEFKRIIDFATDELYSFLYINNHCKDPKNKFRKKLGDIIEI